MAVPGSFRGNNFKPGQWRDSEIKDLLWLEDELSGCLLELYEKYRPGALEHRAMALMCRAAKSA